MSAAHVLAAATLLALLPACQAAGPAAAVPVAADHSRATGALAMPAPRAAHSATRLADGRVLLAGGCHADGCEEGISGDAWLFDPDTSTFQPAGTLVQSRVGHRAIALADGSVLLLGGYTPRGPTALVERYDPESGRFETHGRLREPRDGFTATLLRDGSILVAGGYTDGMRRLDSAERYDPASRRSHAVGSMSTPRMSHTATLLGDGRVLLAGGSRGSREVVDTLELFDPDSDGFAPAGRLATARHKHAAALVGDRVLLFGGAAIPEAAGHHVDGEWWSRDGVTPGPRMARGRYKFLDAVATWPDGRIVVAGGAPVAEQLDAAGDAFLPLDSDFGTALAFATATPLDDGRLFVAGGYDPDIRVSRLAWLLDPSATASAASSPLQD